jgi:hypothetical protein
MLWLAGVTVVVAGTASLAIARSSPAVTLPDALQVGSGISSTAASHPSTTLHTSTTEPISTTTGPPHVVIVRPSEPITDSHDAGAGAVGDNADTRTTSATLGN